MKNEIKIPAMGESISTVTIGDIFAPTGTSVKTDAEILELETDKVNQALYAPSSGKVTLTVKKGDQATIGQVIGYMESAEEESPRKEEGSIQEQEIVAPLPQRNNENGPLRQTKESFLSELKTANTKPCSKEKEEIIQIQPNTTQKEENRSEVRKPLSKLRKIIASRLVEAQQTTAMLTTFNEVEMDQILQLRENYKELFLKKHGVKLGFMSFFVKAVVAALQQYPIFISYLDGDQIVEKRNYPIGVAVGTNSGLFVPVLRNCDRLSFAQIEQQIETYAKQAREGSLKADDLQGGGFTITNGGVYGSLLSTPILNPPQCGILGMHKIEKRAVVVNDTIVIRSMMYLALSYDHRLADGKDAVSFLVQIKNMLENPSRILLDV